MTAVRKTAEKINESVSKVDILICSAGIMGLETYTKSKDVLRIAIRLMNVATDIFEARTQETRPRPRSCGL